MNKYTNITVKTVNICAPCIARYLQANQKTHIIGSYIDTVYCTALALSAAWMYVVGEWECDYWLVLVEEGLTSCSIHCRSLWRSSRPLSRLDKCKRLAFPTCSWQKQTSLEPRTTQQNLNSRARKLLTLHEAKAWYNAIKPENWSDQFCSSRGSTVHMAWMFHDGSYCIASEVLVN